MHLAVHPELLERLDGEWDRGQGGDADVLDEDVLGRCGSSLHAVDDDHVCTCFHRELDVVVGAGGADLDEDRLLPVGDLAELADLDLEIVGPRPVGMPAGAPLVDAFRQVAHRGHPVRDLVAEQHAAAAGLRALADDYLDRVRLAQVVRIHPVPRRQELVDEDLGVAALLGCHAAVAGGRRGARPRSRRGPSASFAGAERAPKLMPAIVIGIFSSSGFFANRVPSVTLVSQRSR